MKIKSGGTKRRKKVRQQNNVPNEKEQKKNGLALNARCLHEERQMRQVYTTENV